MSIDQDQRLGVAVVLDGLGPGPELDGLLEELSAAALTGDDLAAYLRASARQQARCEARTLTAMHHLDRARAGSTERYQGCGEFSGDEVAATLCWSRSMAARKLGLAEDLEVRLPAVGEAVWEGRLDLARAARLCEWTRDLPDELARHVCAVLLPEAPGLPVGELIARIEQVAIELDPDWAARREARARRGGRLILSANPTGTATLSLVDVAATSGLAMRDRVDALAAAVRGSGVLTPIGTLRKEVAERLLDGSVEGLDDHRIARLLAAEYHAHNHPDGPGPDGPDGPEAPGPDDSGPDDSGPGPDDGGGPDGSGPDGSGPDGSGPDGSGPDGSGPDGSGPDGSGPDGSGPDGSGPDDSGPADGDPEDVGPDDAGPGGPGPRGGCPDHEGPEGGPGDADPTDGAEGRGGGGADPEQGMLDLPDVPAPADRADQPEPFPRLLDTLEPGPGRRPRRGRGAAAAALDRARAR